MELRYLGHSCFLLKIDAKHRILLDPFSPKIGLPFPPVAAEWVVSTHDHLDHAAFDMVLGSPKIVKWGESLSEEGIEITPFPSFHDDRRGLLRGGNTIYRIKVQDVTFVHLGDLGHLLDAGTRAGLGKVDVLFAPIGGRTTLDPVKMFREIQAIDPLLVIGMHFQAPGLAETGLQGVLGGPETFLELFPRTITSPRLEFPADLDAVKALFEGKEPAPFLLKTALGEG